MRGLRPPHPAGARVLRPGTGLPFGSPCRGLVPARGLALLPPDPLRCAALAPCGVLFALSASPAAPGPLPLRGSAPGRAARCRFAGPVRRSAPSGLFGPRRARPSAVPPRLPRSGSCAALRASAASRWPRCASALPSLRCGLPVRSPLLRLVLGSGASRVPRRVPPSPPASRLRGRLAPAPGACAALRAACLGASGPRGLLGCARPPAVACCASPWVLPALLGLACALARLRSRRCAPLLRPGALRGVLPCAPRPPPPLGAPGARSPLGGFAPRCVGRAFRAPLAGPPAGCARPRCGSGGAVDSP